MASAPISTFPPMPAVELLETDGEPLESDWHRININLLVDSVKHHNGERQDFYVGGNMFLYFSEEQARNRDFRGPDFFYVEGVPRQPPRRHWVTWLEGKGPDAVIELLSPSTAVADRTTKKDVYEQQLRTPEYFCYDPATELLEGWRLQGPFYRPIAPNECGWLFSDRLQLWLGTWRGTHAGIRGVWLRFYDRQGQVVHLEGEAERERAEAAEAEVARLKARLAELEQGPNEPAAP